MKNAIIGVAGFVAGILIASIYYSTRKTEQQSAGDAAVKCQEPKPSKEATKITDINNPCYGFVYDKLAAPKFASNMGAELRVNREMEVKVSWDGVNGARSYNVYLETKKGENVRTYSTKKTSIQLRDIPLPIEAKEADYVVRIATVNGADKVGDKGEPRPLKVNRLGSVMAPTLRKIEVED